MELVTTRPAAGNGLITEEEAKLTKEDVETIKNAIFKGCQESELKLFLHDCQRQNVHPLDRLIHPTVRTNKKDGTRTYTPITSIDLFRSRADDTGLYAGNDDPVFRGTPKTEDFEASVTVYKIVQGVRCPFMATARWLEYKPAGDNVDWMWQNKPHIMLGKCAEALALRKAFPRQLGRIYVKEEMDQAPKDEPSTQPEHPKQDLPKSGLKESKKDGKKTYTMPEDPERVPDSVTDGADPSSTKTEAAPELFKVLTVGKPKAAGNGAQRYGIMLHMVDDAGQDEPHKQECAKVGDKNAYCNCGTIFFRDTFSSTVVENARKAKGKLANVWSVKNGEFINIDRLEVL